MDIFLYNTLTRKKEKFKPIRDKEVGIYTCGPTVYWYQHIGNLKAYIFSDVLRRMFEYNDFKVKHIINITDVGHLVADADIGDDKMELAAKREGKSAQQVAEYYFNLFESDLKKLNILSPTKWTKATEHIADMIALVKKLEERGFVYKTSDGLYFDSSKFPEYGSLARLSQEGMQAGKRISFGEKKNKSDFALWKFSPKDEKRQQEWESPWGKGFPGWHIECSAMSMKYLGETFDVHTGGEDHILPHHSNEIAQSEAATGKKFVNYWLHEAFLLFNGEKVSKSKGGLYTLAELEAKGYSPVVYRYYNLLAQYRSPMNFSLEILDASKAAYERLKRKILELKQTAHQGEDKTSGYKKDFLEAINDDLNLPKAVQIVWAVLDDASFDTHKKLELVFDFDRVLGLGLKDLREERVVLNEELRLLVAEREVMRKEKRWAESDIIRQKIAEKGFIVKDTPYGPKLEKN